ncbi:hypothetical protein A7K73_00740 [Candidatus Methylacidiphilum fumarolicum]|uniref:Uncharacterized protein n=2 Tax=Candidatus Methylacidiphilum fumarolicum TaxID=591154 RepID=I0JVH2_METFB|nr:hypothetical protein [Candidatus Methylacidiphilum fumarolicum]MBW6414856.1 hypothetical protein [Candidatus Methylacidiphilum fumarolicum]TFE68297.1 hypothetical protein A7K73_00740 [Candidatus Methylacidiphilum fumarolicum]TFE73524.1 hypothetical protein A7K72_06380 [Candidatus Methylacidiphilum fumarolicum]TFE76560.1 hypothetical protein A7D33_09470 [Candidatus Methylacidiphilum fumarolicum]CAI9084570.1 conserved protein of unknown function [Candidatus Methylacidiphilum fumarolicum]
MASLSSDCYPTFRFFGYPINKINHKPRHNAYAEGGMSTLFNPIMCDLLLPLKEWASYFTEGNLHE